MMNRPMKSTMFGMELSKTGKIFGRSAGLKVVMEGDGAKTDGKVIQIPAIPSGAVVQPSTQAIIRGYLDHEAGHVKFSNMKAWGKAVERWEEEGKTKARDLGNALEDIRMEAKVIEQHPGALANLSATSVSVNKDLVEHIKEQGRPASFDDLWRVLPGAVTWEGRRNYSEATSGRLADLVTGEARVALDEAMAGLAKCRTTMAVIKLVDALYEKYDGPIGQPGQGQGQGQGQGAGQGDDQGDGDGRAPGQGGQQGDGQQQGQDGSDGGQGGDGDGDGDDDGNEAAGASDSGNGQGDGSDGSNGQGQEQGQGSGSASEQQGSASDQQGGDSHELRGGVPSGDPLDDYDHRMSNHIKKAYEEAGLIGEGEYHVGSTRWDAEVHRTTKEEDVPRPRGGKDVDLWNSNKTPYHMWHRLMQGDLIRYELALKGLQGEVNVIRSKLMRALLSQDKRGWDRMRIEGKLDTKRLVQAVQGEKAVWMKPDHKKATNTAIYISVDHSGSMAGSEIICAQQCVIALAEALEPTGVKTQIAGFTAYGLHSYATKRRSKCDNMRGRFAPLGVWNYKLFDEPLRLARPAMGVMTGMVSGETPTGCAVDVGVARLLERPEPRKIVLLLTDGRPGIAIGRGQLAHARQAVKDAEAAGVEVYGIGIMDDAGRVLADDRHVNISNAHELAEVGVQMLAKAMLGKQLRVTA